jgi:hypothetical protein
MLDRARFLVTSEISSVIGEQMLMVEEKVDKALERCFMTRARAVARATTKTAKPAAKAPQAQATTRVSARRAGTARAS